MRCHDPVVVWRLVELCALVEPHWLQLGLLHIEDVLARRYIEINRALHSPVSFPGYKELWNQSRCEDL